MSIIHACDYLVGTLMGLHATGVLLTSFSNVRLKKKWLARTNTQSFNTAALINAFKKFYSTGP
jgi:hypothetical protein